MQQLLWPFFNSQKEKTGETGLAEGAVGAALNTVGFGSTYRSGESRTAQIGDVFTGQAGIFEYLTGADIFSKTQIETQKYGMPIKDLPIGERLRAKRLERAAAPKKSAGDRLAEARKKRLAK